MKQRVALFLSLVFLVLAVIHFYWALGGEWGLNSTLPTTSNGTKLIAPTTVDSIIVGLGLTLFGLFYLVQSKLLQLHMPKWIRRVGQWLIPIIFLLRSIGDLRYIGFFKEMKSTEFGTMDTWLYSPLCLIIAVLGFVIIFSERRLLQN